MLRDFGQHYGLSFKDAALLKQALTHRSYLSVTGGGAHESNERLEFLGDSVLGLVTSEELFRTRPGEHEGQLTKTKSLLVSKAILSRRALAMGLGRFVLMSHSEIESGGRQRLSILADAFESVIGAIYLDLGFEAARGFIDRWLLKDASEIVADKRHVNYKSHLQEYVQSTFRTHPLYRIRSEMGPDHSKHFMVEVVAGRRVLGEGRGKNKKEAEQAAARHALDRVTETRGHEGAAREGRGRDRQEAPDLGRHEPRDRDRREPREREASPRPPAEPRTPVDTMPGPETVTDGEGARRGRRRGRRGGRGRRRPDGAPPAAADARAAGGQEPRGGAPAAGPVVASGTPPAGAVTRGPAREPRFEKPREIEPLPPARLEDENEEVGRPEGPAGERFVDPFASGTAATAPGPEGAPRATSRTLEDVGARPDTGAGAEAARKRGGRPEPAEPEPGSAESIGESGEESPEPAAGKGRDPSGYGRRPGLRRRNPS